MPISADQVRRLRDRLYNDLKAVEADAAQPRASIDGHDGRPADGDVSARNVSQALRAQDIRCALERLAAGVFGACLRCGEAIAVERLEANPLAPVCAPCALRGVH